MLNIYYFFEEVDEYLSFLSTVIYCFQRNTRLWGNWWVDQIRSAHSAIPLRNEQFQEYGSRPYTLYNCVILLMIV